MKIEKNSQAFFNILTEPLLVQQQKIHQQKACDLSYLEPEEQRRGMFRRVPRPLAAKDIEKKVNLMELSQDAKKIFLIAPILFLYYELSVCPLILNYNKVYRVASLIANPNL